MSDNRAQEEYVSEFEEDADSYHSGGVLNNIIDLSLNVLIVLASLVATVLATTDQKEISRWIVATVAAIPAAAASLQRIIGIRERSDWYFLYAAQLRGMSDRLHYAVAPNLEEFAKERAELEVEMEKEWLKIGRSGAAPSRRPNTRSAQRSRSVKPRADKDKG